ncbi:MAG: NAD(P)-binding domain-containing protein [Chloroflexi bacterium]|nr:NAD(P)-binding domain-containing protein [Chloroflexota bacterium]
MKVGIIGSGRIGSNVGALLAQAGHEVFYSFSRSEDKLKRLAAEAGDESRWGTPAQAAAFGEVILLSPPYTALDSALQEAGDMAGKIVLDTVNPFTAQGPAYAEGGTAAEAIAGRLPRARLVKAYNHIHYQDIAEQHHAEPPLVAFICGDDPDAKAVGGQLVADTGFYVWDLGELAAARWTEPHGPLFNRPMTQEQAAPIVADLPPLSRA